MAGPAQVHLFLVVAITHPHRYKDPLPDNSETPRKADTPSVR